MNVTNRCRRTDLLEFNNMERMLSPRSLHASLGSCSTAVALDGVNPAYLAGRGTEFGASHSVQVPAMCATA